MPVPRRLILTRVLGAAVLFAGAPVLVGAQTTSTKGKTAATAEERRQHIARATRLSVLSDRITRCQVQKALGVLTGRAERLLADSTQEVRRGLSDLSAAGLPEPARPLLASANDSYLTFLGRSQQLDTAKLAGLQGFAQEADVVGTKVDALVDALIADLAQPVAKVLASAADIQRLTQHNAVHFLLAGAGIQAGEQLKEVADGRQAFDTALKELRGAPIRTPAIESNMQLLEPQWLLMSTALAKPGRDMLTMENICTTSERILEVSTALYGLYESALKL